MLKITAVIVHLLLLKMKYFINREFVYDLNTITIVGNNF